MSASCVLLSVYEENTNWGIKDCFMAVCTAKTGLKGFFQLSDFSPEGCFTA